MVWWRKNSWKKVQTQCFELQRTFMYSAASVFDTRRKMRSVERTSLLTCYDVLKILFNIISLCFFFNLQYRAVAVLNEPQEKRCNRACCNCSTDHKAKEKPENSKALGGTNLRLILD